MLKKNYTITLFSLTLILVSLGLLSVYSASSVIALDRFNNQFYFLIRQGIFAGIGLGIMYFTANFPYEQYKKFATHIFVFCLILLIAVLIPGIGVVRGGARSWLGLGGFGIQPSEFIKLAVVIILSKFIASYYDEITTLTNLVYVGIILMVVFGLIMLQPDFGTGMVIILATVILLFISGLPLKYFFILFIFV